MIRIGVIGLGHIAQRAHLPALARLAQEGLVRIEAVCDVDGERARATAQQFGVARAFTAHKDLLEQETLDALYLIVPPTCHTDVELMAAQRKLPILIEKPPTLDLAQACRFARAFDETGTIAVVGFMMRYRQTVQFVRQHLTGRTPRHALVQTLAGTEGMRFWTLHESYSGGSFVENMIHEVDLLRYLLGEIEAVSAFYVEREPGDPTKDIPHAYVVNLRFKGGQAANCTLSRTLSGTRAGRRQFLILSDGSLLEMEGSVVRENNQELFHASADDNPFFTQARTFVNAVREGNPSGLLSPYRDGMRSLAVVLAANQSARSGGAVIRIDEFLSAAEAAAIYRWPAAPPA